MSKKTVGLLTLCVLSALLLPLAAQADDLSVVLAFLLKPSCDRWIPNYESDNSSNYAAWIIEHQSELELAERDPGLVAKREEARTRNLDSVSATEKQKFESLCSDLADAFQSAAPPDSRFSSPEKTWALFRQGLQIGDRKTSLLCVVGTAKRKFAEIARALSDQQLREFADSAKELALPPLTGPQIEGDLIMQNGRSAPIHFIQLGKNWKIVDM